MNRKRIKPSSVYNCEHYSIVRNSFDIATTYALPDNSQPCLMNLGPREQFSEKFCLRTIDSN